MIWLFATSYRIAQFLSFTLSFNSIVGLQSVQSIFSFILLKVPASQRGLFLQKTLYKTDLPAAKWIGVAPSLVLSCSRLRPIFPTKYWSRMTSKRQTCTFSRSNRKLILLYIVIYNIIIHAACCTHTHELKLQAELFSTTYCKIHQEQIRKEHLQCDSTQI